MVSHEVIKKKRTIKFISFFFNKQVRSDTIEGPMSELGDDPYFGEDDDLEEELNLKTNGDLTVRSYSSRPETNKSTFSQLRGDNKRIRLKYSHPPVFNLIGNNVKRDPTVEYIIESRKSNIIENAYTRLAQTTSQAFQPSQQARINSLKPRYATGKPENQVNFNDPKDERINSPNDKILPLISALEFDTDTLDDGLNNDFDKGIFIIENYEILTS